MSRTTSWPIPTLHGRPTEAALIVAQFLAHRPVPPVDRGDASLYTHRQLRFSGLEGPRVHRVDSTRPPRFYLTSCGLRVPKTDAVLTADDADCQHHGCRPRAAAS